jgi:predicted CoA-binding protein
MGVYVSKYSCIPVNPQIISSDISNSTVVNASSINILMDKPIDIFIDIHMSSAIEHVHTPLRMKPVYTLWDDMPCHNK